MKIPWERSEHPWDFDKCGETVLKSHFPQNTEAAAKTQVLH